MFIAIQAKGRESYCGEGSAGPSNKKFIFHSAYEQGHGRTGVLEFAPFARGRASPSSLQGLRSNLSETPCLSSYPSVLSHPILSFPFGVVGLGLVS